MNRRYLLYNNQLWEPYKTFEYTGDFEEFTLQPDTYLLVANGACGGYDTSNEFISWGGTTYGILDLNHEQTFYAAVGGNAEDGGWNGGSAGKFRGGGGASDIRLSNAPDSSHQEYITVPDGYDELTYLRSTGTQHIDLGYKPTPNTKIECVASVENNGSYGALLGSRTTWVRDSTIIFTNFGYTNKLCWGCGNQEIQDTNAFSYGLWTRHKFIIDGLTLSWYNSSGTLEGSITGASRPANNYTLYLFDLNHAGAADGSKVTGFVYYVKIWENGELVRWYVPFGSQTTTGDNGMYDIIEGKFYRRGDSGTANFVKGSVVSTKTQGSAKTVVDKPSLMTRIIVAGGGGCTTPPSGTDGIEFDYTSFGGGPTSGHLQVGSIASTAASQNGGYSFGDGETGGGGGWYGGYAHGGGSSYVLTSSSYKPTGYMDGYENIYPSLYLRNTLMLPYQAFDGPGITVYKPMERYPITDDVIVVPYTGDQQSMTLIPSKYKFKCYGADGAVGREIRKASKGGYVEGTVRLPEEIPLWYNVGYSSYLNGMYSYGEVNRYFTNADVNTIFNNKAWYHSRGYDNGYGSAIGSSSYARPSTSRYRWTRNAMGGGEVDVRLLESTQYGGSSESKLSRIIVAGGGGGQGSPYGCGGDGGGEVGNDPYGVHNDRDGVDPSAWDPMQFAEPYHGANDGGGNQDGTGGFYFGAVGNLGEFSDYSYPGYGGAGGGGWYTGDGTHGVSGVTGISEIDQNCGGGGGSSYVLTESSYKPTGYIPDERYWMTDTKNITGGNPVRGMTRIEVEPISIPVLVIAKDETSYKAYDIANHTWSSIEVEPPLTSLVFDDYGVNLEEIISDYGLEFPYRLYVCDQIGFDIDRIYSRVIPWSQHVTFSEQTGSFSVRKSLHDGVADDNVGISVDYRENNGSTNVDIVFNTSTTLSEVDTVVYSVELKMKKVDQGEYCPDPPTPVHGTMALCNTRNASDTASGYKPYLGEYLSDGTRITSVDNTVSCVVDRDVYISALVNHSTIRIMRYNVLEDKCYFIRDDISMGTLSGAGACSGALLFRNNKLYLTNSFMIESTANIIILEIPIDPIYPVNRYMSNEYIDDTPYKQNCFGQTYWYQDSKLIFRAKGGHMTFDVDTRFWDFINVPEEQKSVLVNSFAISGHHIMEFPYDAQESEPWLFWADDPEHSPTTVPTYNFANGYKWVTYEASTESFYVVTIGHLYILDEGIAYPTILHDIEIPDDTLQPKSVTYADGFIYITFASTDIVYAYDTNHQEWIKIVLPFTMREIGNFTWNRPAAFRNYLFIGEANLFVTNANVQTRHRIGQQIGSTLFATNSSNKSLMTYDPRFITVDEVGTHYHPGNIVKIMSQATGASAGIFESEEYLREDYLRLLSCKFTEKED